MCDPRVLVLVCLTRLALTLAALSQMHWCIHPCWQWREPQLRPSHEGSGGAAAEKEERLAVKGVDERERSSGEEGLSIAHLGETKPLLTQISQLLDLKWMSRIHPPSLHLISSTFFFFLLPPSPTFFLVPTATRRHPSGAGRLGLHWNSSARTHQLPPVSLGRRPRHPRPGRPSF